MRVLDLGSGAGNVARLAAELVGPDGAVVGVEKDPDAAEFARRHTDAPNVEFRVADAQTLDGIEGGFDAVTGRLILLHLPDPVGALREAAARVRPGGLVIMHECDLGYLWPARSQRCGGRSADGSWRRPPGRTWTRRRWRVGCWRRWSDTAAA